MDPAYRNRFSSEITLEGITDNQAKDLIKARLADFQISDTDVSAFIGDGWLGAQFSGLRQIGVRDLLIAAAERFRALAQPSAKARPRAALADLFAIEVNKIRANEALHRYNQDCLMWLAQALAEGYECVAIHKTGERYFAVQWVWPERSIYFAFEGGDNNARWRAIAREAIALSGSAKHFGAVVFRTPDLKPIPRPTWGVAATQVNEAQNRGLRVVALSLDEVCELHAARELYSNALQGNISYEAGEVLEWLKNKFRPWLSRYSQSAVKESQSDSPPPQARTRNNRERPTTAPETDLSEAQLVTVLDCVSQRMLVDIKEVLKALGNESAQDSSAASHRAQPECKSPSRTSNDLPAMARSRISVSQLKCAVLDPQWRRSWLAGKEPSTFQVGPNGQPKVFGKRFHQETERLAKWLVAPGESRQGSCDRYAQRSAACRLEDVGARLYRRADCTGQGGGGRGVHRQNAQLLRQAHRAQVADERVRKLARCIHRDRREHQEYSCAGRRHNGRDRRQGRRDQVSSKVPPRGRRLQAQPRQPAEVGFDPARDLWTSLAALAGRLPLLRNLGVLPSGIHGGERLDGGVGGYLSEPRRSVYCGRCLSLGSIASASETEQIAKPDTVAAADCQCLRGIRTFGRSERRRGGASGHAREGQACGRSEGCFAGQPCGRLAGLPGARRAAIDPAWARLCRHRSASSQIAKQFSCSTYWSAAR